MLKQREAIVIELPVDFAAFDVEWYIYIFI